MCVLPFGQEIQRREGEEREVKGWMHGSMWDLHGNPIGNKEVANPP